MKARYRLFEFFKDEYNLTLLDSDIDEIVREVIEFERDNEKCNLASINEWVAISDRKPESVLGSYIVCLENEAIFEMNYSSMTDKWWLTGGSCEQTSNPVTHWMEKPSPPCR